MKLGSCLILLNLIGIVSAYGTFKIVARTNKDCFLRMKIEEEQKELCLSSVRKRSANFTSTSAYDCSLAYLNIRTSPILRQFEICTFTEVMIKRISFGNIKLVIEVKHTCEDDEDTREECMDRKAEASKKNNVTTKAQIPTPVSTPMPESCGNITKSRPGCEVESDGYDISEFRPQPKAGMPLSKFFPKLWKALKEKIENINQQVLFILFIVVLILTYVFIDFHYARARRNTEHIVNNADHELGQMNGPTYEAQDNVTQQISSV